MQRYRYNTDILFINKKRSTSAGDWSSGYTHTHSSGLANSVNMVCQLLERVGYTAAVEEAIDNNCIDRLVNTYRPRMVVIEALWVVPAKFDVLSRLHPHVTWFVRLHSEVPFLASEGMAMDWLSQYAEMYPRVRIGANSKRAVDDISKTLNVDVAYMPNYYVTEKIYSTKQPSATTVDVGCFGAVRPLKNHLAQATAAIQYANRNNKLLRFHINGGRVEGRGDSVLNNLRGLFQNNQHELVEHPWYSHDEFKEMLRTTIDVGMQVSFTESYNIVAADMVDCGVPVVASDEIKFVNYPCLADPNDIDSMVDALTIALWADRIRLHRINNLMLAASNHAATKAWMRILRAY